MGALEKTATFLKIRNDIPNQELARELAEKKDIVGIREIAENLFNKNKDIQSDCIKVLYEIGYINPELISPLYEDFMKLITGKNNRLIWGGMIALSTIAAIKAKELFPKIDIIMEVVKKGSVITVDAGIKTLAGIASVDQKSSSKIFPFLIDHLKNCRPKEVAQHSESILTAVNKKNKDEFVKVIESREKDLSAAQLKRTKKVKGKAK